MSERDQIEKIRAVFKIIMNQCNKYTDCQHCPFEKVMDDGSGMCKFRLETGFPGWQLFEMFKDDDNEE